MIDTIDAVPQRETVSLSRRYPRLTGLLRPVGLGLITLISIFMNFYQLGQNGYANEYYASAVRSMLDSWHTFFFVSLDPVGFVSVDKPPLGFWIQTLSAKILGFTPFSLFLPQALAGVISVLILYKLVRRHFGVVAGLLAALALAISPISVVTNRNNTIDSILVLTMLLGAWTVMKAAETGRWRWLMLTAVLVGLGFNIKMLEAYLVVPAYALLYLLAAPRSLKLRLLQLFLATLLMLTVSLSWAVAVDLTPAAQRPYVGSSQNNSELSLALGYNGIQRLLGSFGLGGTNTQSAQNNSQSNTTGTNQSSTGSQTTNGSQPPTGGPSSENGQLPTGGPNGRISIMFNTGSPGLLRLFNEPLGGQIVWLLPIALLALVALAWQQRPRWSNFRENREQQSLLLWGGWLLTLVVFFSVAILFHQYYLSTLAPAIAALFGIGIVIMWRDYRRGGWRGWLLPIALILTAVEQIHIITSNTAWGTWLIPIIAITCGLAALILVVVRLLPRLREYTRILVPVVCAALLALMLTPAVWSAVPGIENIADGLPTAGPSQQIGGPGNGTQFSGRAGFGFNPNGGSTQSSSSSQTSSEAPQALGNGGMGGSVSAALIAYLEAHQGSATYLVAVPGANQAESIILATNKGVMALGGFSGSDPILTTSELAILAKNGTVRYFLLDGTGAGLGGGSQSALTTWIEQHCTVVSASAWQSGSTTTSASGGTLYVYNASK